MLLKGLSLLTNLGRLIDAASKRVTPAPAVCCCDLQRSTFWQAVRMRSCGLS